MNRTIILALSLFLSAHFSYSMSLVHDGMLAISAGYQFKEYGQLFYSFYADRAHRQTDWGTFVTYGFYDGRSPTRVHPWASSWILASLVAYELGLKWCTKFKKCRTIGDNNKKKCPIFQSGKTLMAVPMFLFWSRIVLNMGSGAVRYCASYPIAPLSLYLSGSALAYISKNLFNHIFLHRTKKARPCH